MDVLGDKRGKRLSKTGSNKMSTPGINSNNKDNKEVKRGVGKNLEVNPPVHTPPSEAIKKFGPLNVDAKLAQTAILVLQSHEHHVVIEALNSLQLFCKKQLDNRHLLVALGVVPEAIQLIFSDHQVIQRLAMKILALTSIDHHAKLLLSTPEVCKSFVKLAESKDAVIQEYSTFILSSIATLYTGRLELIQEGKIPLLLDLLQNPDPDIQKNCAEAIYRVLHEPMNIELLTSTPVIKRIIEIVQSEFPVLQQIGLAILAEVATSRSGVTVLEEVDIISILGARLSNPECEDLHQSCLQILLNMSSSKTACLKMLPIVPFLSTYFCKGKDVIGRMRCLKLIGKLAKLPLIAKTFVDLGITKWITAIIACNNLTKMREAGIFAASQLAMSSIRAKIRFTRCIKQVLSMLAQLPDMTNKFREYAWLFLCTVLDGGSKGCEKFIKHNGLFLIDISLESTAFSNNSRISTMNCISLLARHLEYISIMVEANLMPKILKCMEMTTNPQLLAAACNALCSLLPNEKARSQFLKSNAYEILERLILHDEFPVVVSSVPIILALGPYTNVCMELVEKGVLQALWKRQDLISTNGPLRTAFESLLSSHLPTKFAVAGHIDPFEKLENGFYDIGNIKKSENLSTLTKMNASDAFASHNRVIYLNLTTAVDKSLLEQNKILQVASVENKSVQTIIETIRASASQYKTEAEFVGLIATTVAERMGGILDKWRIGAQAEDLEMADIQSRYASVVVPITMINIGAHRPRAILFKAIADAFGIPCSLERGDYKKTWNVILLNSKKPQKLCPCAGEIGEKIVFTEKLRRFVVDLIHHPGTLMPLTSYEANAYCFF